MVEARHHSYGFERRNSLPDSLSSLKSEPVGQLQPLEIFEDMSMLEASATRTLLIRNLEKGARREELTMFLAVFFFLSFFLFFPFLSFLIFSFFQFFSFFLFLFFFLLLCFSFFLSFFFFFLEPEIWIYLEY